MSFDRVEIPVFVFAPRTLAADAPTLVYYHGGGFFFEGAGHHFRLCRRYALELGCRVVYVQYRLAPAHPHPIPSEDCYAALCWVFANAERWGSAPSQIAVGGDSAGGALAAAVCQMARDRSGPAPCFQLLVYPVTDRRMDYDSCRRFTDTPMWNSKLSKKMWAGYLPDPSAPALAYASPMEATRFDGLPPAYVELAEFDCLHDEGAAYAEALQEAGVAVVLNETQGTMHGFDAAEDAPTSRKAIEARIQYMKAKFKVNKNEKVC